jgi:predicted glycosyltransferase
VVITELYPFGRRSLRPEFDALLEAAAALSPRPRILASVRDILAPPSKPARAAEAEAVLARHYDAVLVHTDPADIPLDASWPVTPWLAARLRYTGYIAPPPPPAPATADPDTVIVSAGGADVGGALFETALAAAPAGRRWHLLVGGARAEAECARLTGISATLPGRVVIEPARTDFRSLLAGAGASVSLCGYNTALDLLATGTPGVFVPFDAGRETEQRIRAERLARRPHFATVAAADLTPAALLAALDRVTAAGRFAPDPARLAGARASVDIAERLVAESLTDAR